MPFFALAISHMAGEPLVEADRRVLEDGSDLDRELLARVLCLALPDAPSFDEVHGLDCRMSGRSTPSGQRKLDHEGDALSGSAKYRMASMRVAGTGGASAILFMLKG